MVVHAESAWLQCVKVVYRHKLIMIEVMTHPAHPTPLRKGVEIGAIDSIQYVAWLHGRVFIAWLPLQTSVHIHELCDFDHRVWGICSEKIDSPRQGVSIG